MYELPHADDPHQAPDGWHNIAPAANQAPPSRRFERRRRFGTLALAAAVVAGGAAGAVTSVLMSGGAAAPAVTSAALVPASPTASSSGATVQSLVAKVEPALVDIHTTGVSQSSPLFGNGINPFGGQSQATAAAGTGIILTPGGLVLTNAHVIAGANTITVTFDGQSSPHPATLVGEDAGKDVALIQVQGVSNLPTVTLGDSSQIQVGDSVLAIGNALDLQQGGFTVSNGIISGLNRSIQTDNNENLSGLLQTDAAISSGDSGGPLVDSAGQVIAMDTAAATSSSTNTASNIGFAIPVNEVKALLSRLEKGNIGSPTVGSGSGTGSPSSGNGYGYGSGSGLFG